MPIPAYDPKLIHPLFSRFCPCRDCPYYLEPENWIIKDGTYPVKKGAQRRQRLYCYGGKHRFSVRADSSLFGHHGSFKEYIQTAKIITYGLSCDQIADVLERDSRTILKWQKARLTKKPVFSSGFVYLNWLNPKLYSNGRNLVVFKAKKATVKSQS